MTSSMTTSDTMNAIAYDSYGTPEVLDHRVVSRPSARAGQVLVKVHAAGMNPAEWHMMTGTPFLVRFMSGLRKPKTGRLGLDLAGTVVEVADGVTRHQVGDRVYGAARGSYAEFVPAEADRVNPLPESMTFEQGGGMAIAAITALQGLRDKLDVTPGSHVLINGASGGVGTFAIQIAKIMGAEVTAVCSGRNEELVRSVGADHVIDYTTTDLLASEHTYDALFDNVGSHSLWQYRTILTSEARVVMVGGKKDQRLGPLPGMVKTFAQSLVISQKAGMFIADENAADLAVLHEWFQAGDLTTVIDRTYRLSDAAEAMRYLGTQRARGKVILTIA